MDRRTSQHKREKARKVRFAGPVLFLLLCLASLLVLKQALVLQAAFTRNGGEKRFVSSQDDPQLLTAWAREELAAGRPERARGLFSRALGSNNLYIPAWLGLAELDSEDGRENRVRQILRHLHELTRGSAAYSWDLAMLAYQVECREVFLPSLATCIVFDDQHRSQALHLADTVFDSPEQLLKEVGAAASPFLLAYYQQRGLPEKALQVWPHVQRTVTDSVPAGLSLVDFLINQERIENAVSLWRENFADGHLLFNHKFANPLTGKAFGWRIQQTDGVSWEVVEAQTGRPLMQIAFAGTKNATFNLHQIVPLQAERNYRLTGTMRGETLTTNQRPFWLVEGFRCQGVLEKTPMVGENQQWESFSLTFTVPEGCQAVLISLRRDRSWEFDNKIKGRLQIADLQLTSLEQQNGAQDH